MGRKGVKRGRFKTRSRQRDVDQIVEDLEPEQAALLNAQPKDEDKPGLAQHYCIQCARYFMTEAILIQHRRSKPHKRRLKELLEPVFTQEEADRAGGLGRVTHKPRTTNNDPIVISSSTTATTD